MEKCFRTTCRILALITMTALLLPIMGAIRQTTALKPDPTIDLTWGGTDEDWADGVAVTVWGNIYVAGTTHSFGAGDSDVFIVKYSSDGTILWQKTWGGENEEECCGIVILPGLGFGEYIYVAGTTHSFGAGDSDVFIVKYSSNGTILWQKTWGGREEEEASDILITPQGSVYVVGTTSSFGQGGEDVFILEFAPWGALVRQKTWGGFHNDKCYGATLDYQGNIYLVGETYGMHEDCEGHPFGYWGASDAFLVKINDNWDVVSLVGWCGITDDRFRDVAVDAYGHVYVVGGSMSYGAGADVLGYIPNVILALYRTAENGQLIHAGSWAWGGKGSDEATCIARDSSGDVYVGGFYETTFPTYSESHSFFMRCSVDWEKLGTPDLNVTWQRTLSNTKSCEDIVVSQGNLYIVGKGFGTEHRLGFMEETSFTFIKQHEDISCEYGEIMDCSGSLGEPNGQETIPTGDENQGDHDAFLVKIPKPRRLETLPYPFVCMSRGGEKMILNAAFIVGNTSPHGPMQCGAWTQDVAGAIGIAAEYGKFAEATYSPTYLLDTEAAVYSSETGVTINWRKLDRGIWAIPRPVEPLCYSVIAVGGPLVNMFSYRYDGYGRCPFHLATVDNRYVIRSDLTGENYNYTTINTANGPVKVDHALIAMHWDDEAKVYVLVVWGISWRGTVAACKVLQAFMSHGHLLEGNAVIIRWEDTNQNNVVDWSDTMSVMEKWS